jgi:3-dehydroquinate synthase
LHRAALDAALPRDGLVIAIGGGTIGDLAGFFAATWMRGVDWCPVATTTLSIADSAVGGKTAVDLAGAKNLIGAFHQPVGVYAALEALETLPGRHRRAGLAEVVKSGVIADAALLRALERDSEALRAGDPQVWARALEGALRVKARVVARDPRETGQREILNFGHTLGHALEAGVRPTLLHGEAVALGMIAAAWLSERCVAAPAGTQERIVSLLRRLDLVVKRQELDSASVWKNMRYDKKRRGSQLRFVLTPAIGSATVGHPVGRKLLQGALGAVSGVCARGPEPRRSGAKR